MCFNIRGFTTRKSLINDTFNASLKSYNDTFLKRHGIDCHCICLNAMTLVTNIIFYELKH